MLRHSLQRLVGFAAAATALVLAAPVLAQEAQPPDDAPPEARHSGIEEIIVTATKRAANVQDIPIAVTAITDVQIERGGLQDIRDLPNLSPSFNMNSSNTTSGGTTLRIRGVGTTGNNDGLESAVGVFLDGVYFSRPGIALGDLVDVEAIEVLRGPQGTLFGRNTSAGALHIRTKKPDLSELEAWAAATAGNYDFYNVQTGVSIPLVDDMIAARLSVAYRDQDGYMKSVTGARSHNKDRYSLRGQLLWAVTEDIELRLIGDYAKAKEDCCDASLTVDDPSLAPFFLQAGLPADGGAPFSGHGAVRKRLSNSQKFENPSKQWGVSGELTWDLGEWATLTSLSAYRRYDSSAKNESDYVALRVFSVPRVPSDGASGFGSRGFNKSFSQELRLQGEFSRLDWLVGFYFSDEKINTLTTLELQEDYTEYMSALFWYRLLLPAVGTALDAVPLNTGGTFFDVRTSPDPALAFAGGADSNGNFAANLYTQDGNSWSLFTHNTLHITDQLDAVVGLRWIDEKKDGAFGQIAAFSPACENTILNMGSPGIPAVVGATARAIMCFPFATRADFPLSPAETFSGKFKDDELAYTAALFYAVTDYLNVYFSFSHGFKAGGFNLDSTAAAGGADPRFLSETVDAYEGGVKATLFDRMRANLAVFHQEMDDFQVLEFTGTQFRTFNVPTVKATGFELETATNVLDGLDVSASVTYANSRYPNDCAPASAALQVRQLCGGLLTNSPKWVGMVGFNWEDDLPWGENLSYFLGSSMRIESKRRTSTQWRSGVPTTFLLPDDFQSNNEKVNARLGITGPEESWSFEIWATNVFDKTTKNVTFNTPLRGNALTSRGTFVEAPRMYGATIRVRI